MEKKSVAFLAVPNSLKDEIKTFELNPLILLPVELESPELRLEKETIDLTKLSWEMILSGMLRVISAKAKSVTLPYEAAFKAGDIVTEPEMAGIPQEWIDYYRSFIFSVKPEIYHEFTSAAIVKTENGDFDMALEISDILEGLFPRSPGVLLNKALILEKRAESQEKNSRGAEKENAQALEAYHTALSVEPVLPDTFFNAGFFFMRHRDFARAKDCFTRYVSIGEESEDLSDSMLGEIPDEKRKQAQKIIQEISGQCLDDTSYREAYDCIIQGNDEMGLLKIREFLEKHPKAWNGWFVLGWALRKLGRYANGLEAFKKAASLGGTSSDIRNETAICLMELGDHKGARKELEHALQEEPANIKIISNLGVLAMKAGNKNEAAAFFRTVLELDPADPLASHFLADL
ncbi:MAG: tetratricopeptide repeat protein [Treponema sp.]|nr:tetratricopeptide repeat protein [Treponema sp.]